MTQSFRDMHRKGDAFLMVNVWDAGSARIMAALGARALATSSAAQAYGLGRPDCGTLTRDEALAHAEAIVAATDLPVQGDFENGFGDDPDTCAETVRLAASVGLAGICIEDTICPTSAAYDFDLAVDRIRAAASAARALPDDFVLTARADGIMTGTYDTDAAIRRLQGFASAGADCLYAPMPPDMAALQRIVAAVDIPVNALVAGRFTTHSQAEFARIGVARLSVGSAFARALHQQTFDLGQAMLSGDFNGLVGKTQAPDFDALLAQGARATTGIG